MSHEQVNDVPVLMHTLKAVLGLDALLDELVPRHGNRQGASIGETMVMWLTHLLSECNHFMNPVQDWANHLLHTLSTLLGRAVRPTDFTDDRLAEVAWVLSHDDVWHPLEQSVTGRVVRAYELKPQRVRLDSTTAKVYGGSEVSVLFQRGHSKDHRPDLRQLKLMLAALDPLGLLAGVDVLAGQTADDGLYVPMIQRMRETLQPEGLLYVGDCKMGALRTRAYVQATGNAYLMPLAQVGRVPDDLAGWVERALSGQVKLKRWRDEETHEVLAEGYEVTRAVTGQPPEETGFPAVTWSERVLIVRSPGFAQAAQRGLRDRLSHARTELLALTPPPGRGHRSVTAEAPLREAAQAILERHDVVGLLTFDLERQGERRAVRAYRDRPARVDEVVRYTLTVQRQAHAIRAHDRTLGWRAYVTNAAPENLSFEQTVQTYRDEWLIERDCARLKGRVLSLSPLWVSREDHAIGLTRLLTLAARVLALVEYDARRKLKASSQSLAGLYAGQPTRVTDRPTTERLLKAFDHIALVVIRTGREAQHFLTPLNELQRTILDVLGYPNDLYQRLVNNSA
ncbi:MAG: IS1634 family transposase [Chloroflexi bacterium]|nr:IS1634 family transposase [Chloroflexota bacterium]